MFMHANKEMHAGNADGSYPKAGVWKLLYPPQALFWGEGGIDFTLSVYLSAFPASVDVI